jgi:hypothetical protein
VTRDVEPAHFPGTERTGEYTESELGAAAHPVIVGSQSSSKILTVAVSRATTPGGPVIVISLDA